MSNPVSAEGQHRSVTPTMNSGDVVPLQMDASGNLLVNVAVGTISIGQVSASGETSTIYNGTTPLTPAFATIAISATGTIVGAVGGKIIRVVALSLMANGTVNAKFQSHVTPTDITGLYYLVVNTGFVLPYNPVGWFQTISGEALDLNLSVGVAVGGCLTYITL